MEFSKRTSDRGHSPLRLGLCVAALVVAQPASATGADNSETQQGLSGCTNGEAVNFGALASDLQSAEVRQGGRMVGMYPCWSADLTNSNFRYMNDLYAQWSIQQIIIPNSAAIRDYDRERKPAWQRLFVGQNKSVVASVKIFLKDPDVDFVVPLATFGYGGRVGQGESWITELVADHQSLPFFRMSPSTSATVIATAKSTSDVEVKATGTIISALRSFASIASLGDHFLPNRIASRSSAPVTRSTLHFQTSGRNQSTSARFPAANFRSGIPHPGC